ncbi:hypothetical protein [Hymenobacter cellulosilyticus]|uniref:Uncharacterized protein n=1 Tax=Hymenobacter cellulosilyticus TaxID=2932248 RepID=A0A8T9QEQ9_9BACT|nr:hypothetical protein [Hymenobacter cellulosilyticus]UOQ74039.1 hypothetical protein MUN79_09170 [Hymenobacter cellulosilyticus]
MSTIRTFSAPSEESLWPQVSADLAREPDLLEYSARLEQRGLTVLVDIDVDLGGGFEGGMSTTTLTASVPGNPALRFALHEQDWVHELGKLLGLTDVELGDPALDDAFIITTNDADALRQLLTPGIREVLLRHADTLRFSLAPADDAADAPLLLTFAVDDAILDPSALREVYHVVFEVLEKLAAVPGLEPAASHS